MFQLFCGFFFGFSLMGARFWWKQKDRGMCAQWVGMAIFFWAAALYL
jgi:hypothetical protein